MVYRTIKGTGQKYIITRAGVFFFGGGGKGIDIKFNSVGEKYQTNRSLGAGIPRFT